MALSMVTDIEWDDPERYGLILVAVGSEKRSTAATRVLLQAGASLQIVHALAPSSAGDREIQRRRAWYEAQGICVADACPERPDAVYELLNRVLAHQSPQEPLRIAVDYSSMPRTWYAAVLNWLRLQPELVAEVDFIYALGEYPDEWVPKQVLGMSTVLGTGDRSIVRDKSLALFGLGFDSMAAMGIREQIEPDEVFAFYADPGVTDDSADRALTANADFLHEVDGDFGIPLNSVETAFRVLGETVSFAAPTSAVTLVPLGPKPHVLASLLVSHRFPGTSCLQVRHRRRVPNAIPHSGSFVLARACFDSETR